MTYFLKLQKRVYTTPSINILNEFSPEIISGILDRFRPSEYQEFVIKSAKDYSEFIQEYFGFELKCDQLLAEQKPLFVYLEEITSAISEHPFGLTVQPDTRRRPIVVLLFIMHRAETLNIPKYENFLRYIKLSYSSLTPLGKKELIYAFNKIVQHNRRFANAELYFKPLDEVDFETARLHFFDTYMKDDFINEITSLLNFQERKIRSFKESIRGVAKSDELNLDYLHEFVRKRKEYRKLFLVTSAKRLPKRIQHWIRQQPHFILGYVSIANLPRIGLSSRFDIFFFSPINLSPTAESLYEEFVQIDKSVGDHPLKIYEIDPSESLGIGLSESSPFSEAITYFETTSFETTSISDLSYEQLISILENRRVSLLQVISELPPSEFSTSVTDSEKRVLNQILSEFITPGDDRGVFMLASTLIKDVKTRLQQEGLLTIEYSADEIEELYAGNVSTTKKRSRLLNLFRETKDNLQLISEFIP